MAKLTLDQECKVLDEIRKSLFKIQIMYGEYKGKRMQGYPTKQIFKILYDVEKKLKNGDFD